MKKIAIVQMISSSDVDSNTAVMRKHFEAAVAEGASLVVFPEMAYLLGTPAHNAVSVAEFEKLRALFASWAAELGTALVPGSLREPSQSGRYFNTTLCFDGRGKEVARYRKIFLFEATLPERRYQESEFTDAGDTVVTVDLGWGKLGLAICYDLRFPELFRKLKKEGSELVLLPSAFTVPTGKAHWEILVKARAIENQFFVAAPGLVGKAGDGFEKYGHSLAVSPWGETVASFACPATDTGIAFFNFQREAITAAKQKVDAWASRRDDLFS